MKMLYFSRKICSLFFDITITFIPIFFTYVISGGYFNSEFIGQIIVISLITLYFYIPRYFFQNSLAERFFKIKISSTSNLNLFFISVFRAIFTVTFWVQNPFVYYSSYTYLEGFPKIVLVYYFLAIIIYLSPFPDKFFQVNIVYKNMSPFKKVLKFFIFFFLSFILFAILFPSFNGAHYRANKANRVSIQLN